MVWTLLQYPKKKPNSSKDKVWPLGYFTWHPKGCLSDHSLHKGTHLQSPLLLSAHPSPPTALTSRTFRNWPALCRHPDRKELHQEASYSVLSSLVPMCFPSSPSMLILGLKRTHHLWGAGYLWHMSNTPPKPDSEAITQTLVMTKL